MKPIRILHAGLPLVLFAAMNQNVFPQTPGIECGCDTTGAYVAPSSKAIKVEDGDPRQEIRSPGGTYTVEYSPADYPYLVHLQVKCGSKTILTETSRAGGWGFSPDGDRFVTHGLTLGGQHWITLYNLDPDPSVTGEDAIIVRQTAPTFVTSASLRFSPHGKYLLYAALGYSGTLMLYIYNTEDGSEAYKVTGGAPIVGMPSGKSIAGWGFSPDIEDRTFVHAYLTDSEKYTLIVKNLATGQDVLKSFNNSGIASFRFSLCGDYFLWSKKVGTGDRYCEFYKTSEVTPAPIVFNGDELVSVKTDASNHIVKFLNDINEYTFPNTAHAACDDDDPPVWPAEAGLDFLDATGTTIDLSWDAAADAGGFVQYRVLQDNIVTMEIEETSCEVSGLSPAQSFGFKVEAGDAIGNWTENGPSVQASTEYDSIPEWISGTWLSAPDVQGVKMKLEWYGARDDWGITGYRIFRNGDLEKEIDGADTEYWVTGLVPEESYTFKVEAGDAAGHWTTVGPQLIQSTAIDDPPYWEGTPQIYLDEATETSIAFHWDAATDLFKVDKYRISRVDADTVILPGHVTEYLEEELEEGQSYTFHIEAGDEAGNWSTTLSEELMTIPSHVELPLVVAAGYQGLPDIDDRLVVWQDHRNGNADIFNYNLKTDTEDDLITDPEWQGQPKSSDGKIVWADNRNGNYDIYMYDMYDPQHRVVALCDNVSDQITPSIDGNTVVWADYRSGNWDIYMLDLLTMEEKPVCTNSSSQTVPDVSGNVIVWEDARNGNPDIYGYIISTEEEFEVCKQKDEQRNPAVETEPEYRIFWEDNRNGNFDIYMRVWFVNSYEILKVYLNYTGDQIRPDIQDEVLVFQDNYNGSWDIYSYTFYNRYYGNMEPVCLEDGDQMNPRTSKGRIVWEDRRNDDGDIYIWDRPPGTDLSLELEESADPVAIGKTLVYELAARNNGPDDEDSAKVVCTLPVEAFLADTSVTTGSIDKTGLTLTWHIGSLPVDSSEVLRLYLKTYYLATLSFKAAIEGDGFDPDPSNNRISETSEVKLVAGEILEQGYSPSLFADPNGIVYLTYGTDDSVVFASKILQGAWHFDYLDTVSYYTDSDILMDADGNMHICYSDQDYENFPDSRLYYLTNKNQGFWEDRIIALSDSGFSSISMDAKDHGTIHMMYQQSPGVAFNSPFKYMNNRDGSWGYPDMFYPDGYDHIDMAVDDEGYAHAVFIGINKGPIYQKSQDTIIENWSAEELIEEEWRGGQLEGMVVDIGLDNTGVPHIIYPGGTDGDHEENIKYAVRKNDTWHVEEIDDGDFGSAANAIVVEPSGVVHVCYSHFPSHQIRYATNVAGPWIKQTIEREANTWFSDLDMALDGYGNVHIVYVQDDNVIYALRPPIEYFTVEPDTLDFGTVQVDESKTLYLKLFNESAERILIDSARILDDRGYVLDFMPFTLYKGVADSIPVTFAPSESMQSDSHLRICFTGNSKMFMEIPVMGTTPVPELSVSPDPVDFGTLEPYNYENRTVTLTNNGTVDLIISEITVKYELYGYEIDTDFDLVSENCTVLGPGETCQAEIQFYPTSTGTQQSYLNITSNDPDEPYKQIYLTGNAQYPRALISVNPYTIDFGYVETGETASDTIHIGNSGDADLTISNVTLTGTNADQFEFTHTCTTVTPGETCPVNVDFNPLVEGDFSASLRIYSNSVYSNPYTVTLNGSSLLKELSVSDQNVDFGQKLIGEDSMAVITLTNTGDSELTISELSISGRDMYEFLHTGWNGVLSPDESCNDTLWFAPIFAAEKSAVLHIVSNDTDEPEISVPLTGIAVEGVPALQVSVDADPKIGEPPLEVLFTAHATGGSVPYTYDWDFDDGSGSQEQNPLHTFTGTGTYVVNLTVTDQEASNAFGSVTITVTDEIYSISGLILDEDGTTGITSGTVELITEETAELEDQTFLDGTNAYNFDVLPGGTYTVRFLPDQDDYPNGLPTYLGDVLMMYEATLITIDGDKQNQDIHMQNKPGTGSEEGTIDGNLVEETGKKNMTVRFGNAEIDGSPLEGIYVYLVNNSDGTLAGADVTDMNGYFGFTGLSATSYRFQADYMGIPMNESNPLLTITEANDSISIVASVSSTDISTEIVVTGIDDKLLKDFKIYPNPASSMINILFNEPLVSRLRVDIFDISGQLIKNIEIKNASGMVVVPVSLSDIQTGFYILKLQMNSRVRSAALIIR